MICPNKNSQYWKDLVNKYGETDAYTFFRLGGSPNSTTIESETSLFRHIYNTILSNPEYFQKKYSKFLATKTTDYSTLSMAYAFYYRVDKYQHYVIVGDTLVNGPEKYPIFPHSDEEFKQAVKVPDYFNKVLSDLKQKFNVDYVVIDDKDSKFKGRYVNSPSGGKLIVINLAYATKDTPLHEYYHPFVRLTMTENPKLYESLLKQTNSETEEDLVEALGKMAAAKLPSSSLSRFLAFISRLINSVMGVRSFPVQLTPSSTVEEVIQYLLNSDGVDVSQETTLMSAYQVKKIYEGAEKIEREKYVIDIIDLLRKQSQDLTTNDTTDYYMDLSGNEIAKRLTALVSGKNEGEFSGLSKAEPRAIYQAKLIYAQNRIAVTDNITIGGKSLTFDDLVAYLDAEYTLSALYGKAGHALFQYLIEKDPIRKMEAKKNMEEYQSRMEEQNKDTSDLNVVQRDFDYLLEMLGISESDRIASELSMVSDKIITSDKKSIGTTADGVVQHANGEVTLFDLKFGNITRDMYTNRMLKYAGDLNVKDSSLSRAYLELAFRALIMKEKFPEVRFRDVKLLKVDANSNHRVYNTDLGKYLQVISNYYKATNPELHKELESRNLFDVTEYQGESAIAVKYADIMKNMSLATKLDYVEAQLKNLTLSSSNRAADSTTVRQERAHLALLYQELSKAPGVDLKRDTDDLSGILGDFKNLSDIEHPQVQQLHKEILKVKGKMREEFQQISKQEQALFKKVLLESTPDQEQRNFIKRVTQGVLAGTIIGTGFGLPFFLIGAPLVAQLYLYRTNKAPKNLFGFMWRKGVGASAGHYLNTLDTYTNEQGQEVPLTQAQREYRDFIASTLRTKYEALMQTKVYDSVRGKALTYAQVLKMPATLPDDFLPRIPKSTDELRLEQAFSDNFFGVKTRAAQFVNDHFTSFFEENFENTQDSGGLPLRYFLHAGSNIVENSNHSFDVSKAFNLFLGNMLNKEYYDPLYSLAEGVRDSIELAKDESGKQKYPNLSKFLGKEIMLQILKDAPRDRSTTKDITFTVGKWGAQVLGLEEGTRLVLNQHRALMALKHGVSFAVMSFKAVNATFNAALIGLTNMTIASKAAMASILGIPPDDIHANSKAALAAYADYKDFLVASMQGKESKLAALAEKFDWVPDSYDYLQSSGTLLYDVTSPSMFSNAFMFHNAAETYGSMIHLSMMLRSTMIEGADGKKYSLWDAYDKEGNWTKGVRGSKIVGDSSVELSELDELEIKSLKRQYEKMHGSYRYEEKVAIEASVIGQFLVQFKKFFFTYMKNLFASPYTDITVGRYVQDHSIKRPDGMPIWKWESEIHQGRLRVLSGAVMSGTKWRDYLGPIKGASKEQRMRQVRLVELANTALWFTLLWVAIAAAFDDDEKKSYAYRRMMRLRDDMSQGLSVKDFASSIQQPFAAADKTAKTLKAFSDWVMFDYNKDGTRKGAAYLQKDIPILSLPKQVQDLFSSSSSDQELLFGIFPKYDDTKR